MDSLTGISNFSMIGQGGVMYNKSEEGAPLPNSTIYALPIAIPKMYLKMGYCFTKLIHNSPRKLDNRNCGAMFTVRGPDNFTLVSALTFRESYNISLKQVRIDKNLGFGLDADRIFGSFRVSMSAFMWCRAYTLSGN